MNDFTKDFMLWALCFVVAGLCSILWYLFSKVTTANTDILLLKQAQDAENSGYVELKKMIAELILKVDRVLINESRTSSTIERLEKDIERIENSVK